MSWALARVTDWWSLLVTMLAQKEEECAGNPKVPASRERGGFGVTDLFFYFFFFNLSVCSNLFVFKIFLNSFSQTKLNPSKHPV